MAWIGYRPYVPADPARGLRPGTKLPVVADGDSLKADRPRFVSRVLLRARGLRRRRSSRVAGAPTDVAPAPASPLRLAVALGGLAWAAVGVTEAFRGSFFFGLLVAGVGVLALRRSGDIGRTSDERVPLSDRGDVRWWLVVPALAVPLLVRLAWLLTPRG